MEVERLGRDVVMLSSDAWFYLPKAVCSPLLLKYIVLIRMLSSDARFIYKRIVALHYSGILIYQSVTCYKSVAQKALINNLFHLDSVIINIKTQRHEYSMYDCEVNSLRPSDAYMRR